MKTKKPVSEAQLAANRANSKKSTGPRTAEGKARAARNSITHGLTARDTTILGEDYTQFVGVRGDLVESFQPRNKHEAYLIERLASLQIRLQRCVRQETGLLDMEIPDVTPENTPETINSAGGVAFSKMEKTFLSLSRYESQIARQFDQVYKQLLAARKEGLPPKCETKPIFVEKNKRELGSEANLRFQLDPPMDPALAENRRTGTFIPPPKAEPVKPQHVLIWEDNDGNEWMRTDGQPLKQADGTYKPNPHADLLDDEPLDPAA